MFAMADLHATVRALHARIGSTATAVISRNGGVLFAELPAGMFAETFAIMCATVFGAAGAAAAELGRSPPRQIILEGSGSRTVLVGNGGTTLLVAVVDDLANLNRVLEQIEAASRSILAT